MHHPIASMNTIWSALIALEIVSREPHGNLSHLQFGRTLSIFRRFWANEYSAVKQGKMSRDVETAMSGVMRKVVRVWMSLIFTHRGFRKYLSRSRADFFPFINIRTSLEARVYSDFSDNPRDSRERFDASR